MSNLSSVSSQKKSAFFIGPEGGFDPKELEKLATMKQAISIHLGRRILRAETASIVALACYNQVLGWKA